MVEFQCASSRELPRVSEWEGESKHEADALSWNPQTASRLPEQPNEPARRKCLAVVIPLVCLARQLRAYRIAQRAGRWPDCSGKWLSDGNSILRNFLPMVNGFLVFAIENSFERPDILVTHDTPEILLSRQHGRSCPTLRHRLVPPSAYSSGPSANARMRVLNQVCAG